MNQNRKILKAPLFISMRFDHNWNKDGYPKEWHPYFWLAKSESRKDLVFLEERTIEIDITGFNPVPTQVAALEKEKEEALEQYQKSVAEINRQLSELLAIENNVPKGRPDNVT